MAMRRWKLIAAVLALAATAACAYRPTGEHPLAPYPDGTADTTHGAVGVQTSPH
jgi:hypothetical protein